MEDFHEAPNFDVASILFYGDRIPSHLASNITINND